MEDRAIVIRPNGRLANRMFQYMLATEIGRRVGDAIPVCGLALPEWNIALPAPGSHANPTVVLERHVFNLDRTAYLLRTHALRTVVINGWGMRLEYYRGPEAYRPSFPLDAGSAFAARDDQLLINIRAEDILSGWHPRYFPLPFSFYEHVIERTGLSPVFMGQLDDGPYCTALRRRFPAATFLPAAPPLADFQTLRRARHVVLGVSSFSWLAAWLSESALDIHLPVCGLFDPRNGETMMLPIDDGRYRFYDVAFPSMAERESLDLVNWASLPQRVGAMDPQQVRMIVIDSMLSRRPPGAPR